METPLKVEGIDYTPEGVAELREAVIELRDEALKQNAFEHSVMLSHVIAILAYYVESGVGRDNKPYKNDVGSVNPTI